MPAYSAQVGERLRSIRKQKRLSLHEVEAQSDQEFKASVLGAYERGERALSVPRLDRLAQFYRCRSTSCCRAGPTIPAAPRAPGRRPKLAIDIVKLTQLSGAPFEMLTRFLRMIQVQRQDFNGRVLTIRRTTCGRSRRCSTSRSTRSHRASRRSTWCSDWPDR